MPRVTIDKNLCLGKKSCVEICRPKVFGWQKAEGVGLLTRAKLMIESGGYQAVVANAAACTACMDCVRACPEGAIEVEMLTD